MPPRLGVSLKSELCAAARASVGGRTGSVAAFSTSTPLLKINKQRRRFWDFERGEGQMFASTDDETGPKYYGGGRLIVKNKPFNQNPSFNSRPILDEPARHLIWEKIMKKGETIKAVSAEFGIDIRRVAAVVRLVEVERDMLNKGKPMAKPFARAVYRSVPTFSLEENVQNKPLEPISEIHVHPKTMHQIFWPTSESRHFTRADAARAFGESILPADKRTPHPELIQMERDMHNGISPFEASERFKKAAMESEQKASERKMKAAADAEQDTTRHDTQRFEFRFQDYDSSQVGPTGRARNLPGWKYGAPFYDRTKGQVKIPTSVP